MNAALAFKTSLDKTVKNQQDDLRSSSFTYGAGWRWPPQRSSLYLLTSNPIMVRTQERTVFLSQQVPS